MRKVFLAFLFLILLAACSKPAQETPLDYLERTSSVDLSEEHAFGIKLGDSVADMEGIRGQPLEMLERKPYTVWEYGDSNYTISNDRVIGYGLYTSDQEDRDKLLEEAAQSVKDRYGGEAYNRIYDKYSYKGYIDKEKEWVLEIVYDSSRVVGIMMAQLSLFEQK